MPFAFIFVGLLLLVSGVRNTTSHLISLVEGDIEGGFFPWIVVIFLVGAVGYVQSLRTFSRVFLALIIVALLLSKQGFFSQLSSALSKPAQAAPESVAGDIATGASNSFASIMQQLQKFSQIP